MRNIPSAYEDLDLVNHGMGKVQFNLEIAMRSDFADIFEVNSGDIVLRGRITASWSESDARFAITYINKVFERRVTVTAHKWDCKPVYANGQISFELELKPGQAWHGIDMSGRRPLIKGYFAVLRLIVGAVMSSAYRSGHVTRWP